MARKKITAKEVCRRAGLAKKVVWYWKRAYSPRVANLEAALNSIGYRLAIVPKDHVQ